MSFGKLLNSDEFFDSDKVILRALEPFANEARPAAQMWRVEE